MLATLAPGWRQREMRWSPRSGSQLEFGRHLRQTLEFRTQALAISEDNLRWTARARFGTYKFFGFVATDGEGYAVLTPAGERFATSSRPGEVLLRQLLKWQYPDHQHRGRRWPATDFSIFPFVATARVIRELDGLTRQEVGLFCFTMRRTEDAAATAEAIRQFRERQRRSTGRTGKARSARGAQAAAEARYAAEGRRVVLGSTDDYADALIRAFRYTGLFSVRGARIVVASGREAELDELIFEGPPEEGQAHPARLTYSSGRSLQLALGEAPPLRLAAPRPLFAAYEDGAAFYAYYGDAQQPPLPWESAPRLAAIARSLDATVADLRVREARLRTGRTVLGGPVWGTTLPEDYESLVEVVEGLRRTRVRLERSIDAAEAATPRRLAEALAFYRAVLAREVIDPPTYLEWNTWRVFLALGQAREVVPHLALDDDLQPLNTAPGNLPDLEVDYGAFRLVVEVTLRTGADQRQAEGRPVTRHLLEAQRRAGGLGVSGVYGLFVAPRLHVDTVTDFLVALKYRVIERQQLNVIPLTVRQLVGALRPFASEEPGGPPFSPEGLRALLDRWVVAALEAETGEDWLEGIDAALRRWLAAQGARPLASELAMAPLPLPLF